MSSLWLNNHRNNVTSQFGEDGIIEAVFDRIGIENKWCCEFGAWDGKYLSNTYNLIHNHGWSGVLIEGDKDKIKDLAKSERVYPIQAMVSDTPPNDLDTLLAKTPIPKNFDLLSVDVDNDDYLIWRALTNYQPRVVIIEINSYLAPDVEKIPRRGYIGRAKNAGASILSTVQLAKAKGYELAIHTGNCIFVKREFASLLELDTENWQELFDSSWVGCKDQGLLGGLRLKAGHLARRTGIR